MHRLVYKKIYPYHMVRMVKFIGGERGIWTLGTFLFTCFRDKHVRPLRHLSIGHGVSVTKKDAFFKCFHIQLRFYVIMQSIYL